MAHTRKDPDLIAVHNATCKVPRTGTFNPSGPMTALEVARKQSQRCCRVTVGVRERKMPKLHLFPFLPDDFTRLFSFKVSGQLTGGNG